MHFAWRTSDAQRQAIVADIASHFDFVQQEDRRWRVATPERVVNKIHMAIQQVSTAVPSVSHKLVPPTTVVLSSKQKTVQSATPPPLKRVTVAANKPIVYCGGVEAGYGEQCNIAYWECIQNTDTLQKVSRSVRDCQALCLCPTRPAWVGTSVGKVGHQQGETGTFDKGETEHRETNKVQHHTTPTRPTDQAQRGCVCRGQGRQYSRGTLQTTGGIGFRPSQGRLG
jgi:hypothetical protein